MLHQIKAQQFYTDLDPYQQHIILVHWYMGLSTFDLDYAGS